VKFYEPTQLPGGAALPARLLPHQLAHAPDLSRTARHEAGLDQPLPLANAEEAINYGLWWHETLEFVPWAGDPAALAEHGERALAAAEAQGFRERAAAEWARLLASEPWREMRAPRWTRLAELAVFAPLRADAWIDGVMDLVLHDAAAEAVWVVDWKTNRRRPGESDAALLARLVAEYAPQLQTYGNCLEPFFPGCAVRRLVFSTAAGRWAEVSRG
jgi:ATP-dependent exoDNAse (exonuclease V) beta subunit